MSTTGIPANLVNGFLESGKTTYIHDCMEHDFFYKRGRTLLLSFEEGETEYDEALLASRNTDLRVYPGEGGVADFVLESIQACAPDRIYVEMNAMMPTLYETLAELLTIRFSITLVDGTTFPIYFTNLRQQLQDMVKASHQVIFNRMEKDALTPYGNLFRVINKKAVYLWEGPTGYHEKAFGIMVPYDREQEELQLTEEDFTPFYLDSLEAPALYEGKQIQLLVQVELPEEGDSGADCLVGRRVMTCCAADIQYLSLRCRCSLEQPLENHAWIHLQARGTLQPDRYGQKVLVLEATQITPAKAPAELVIGMK